MLPQNVVPLYNQSKPELPLPMQDAKQWEQPQQQRPAPFKIALKVDDTSYSFKMLDLQMRNLQ